MIAAITGSWRVRWLMAARMMKRRSWAVRHHCNGMRFPLAVVVCLSLLLTPGGFSQQEKQKPADEDTSPTIQVEVNLINLLCSVRDKHGAYMNSLTKDDFAVAEDGRTQEIKYFTR